jgi:acyl-CoA synthetase (AMP-forming)/AMP-acid ligase II
MCVLPCCVVQSSKNLIRWAFFQLAVAAKSFWMKRGWRHDQVRPLAGFSQGSQPHAHAAPPAHAHTTTTLQASPLADLLVFSTIKKRLGGRVRLILSGAAPLATPVQEMLSCCMCAPVLQGYGLTETCAASTIAEPYNWDAIGTVGGPIPGGRGWARLVAASLYTLAAQHSPSADLCWRAPDLTCLHPALHAHVCPVCLPRVSNTRR